ncbi:transcriptional regulator [Novacetimonas hansenii]|uniref:MucR family transcriptional regulator n=2 Tax=Novacetimonas hansenii TaxID=436 RepID=A0ABQ0SI40_NOVHA|nr:MucR family transcriptional regulator [Novacetimonas hansenii]EFG85958.1 transcriptional regulator, MucR family protein [Novacetimonas hansenii ATCC 23769]GAN82804.1 transcriptional regulator Ros/MucR [Novacetimonas hansenii JCM 7643]GBQ52611.1 Ros/MucR family transcriptional regulator [Novacetimonas hansenii NRIC 0243]GEC65146.1 hypothetical protein GHA01_29950 [Novacetimonas hansenii]
MSDNETKGINTLHVLTTDIVASFLSSNSLPTEQIPELIHQVYNALTSVEDKQEVSSVLTPAVPIKKSVFPDYIICLEDGKKLKMLKRHLMTAFGMTPADYRTKWGLPSNYPMVAPAYGEQRSKLAKEIGLGKKEAEEIEPQGELIPVTKIPEVKRGRKSVNKK